MAQQQSNITLQLTNWWTLESETFELTLDTTLADLLSRVRDNERLAARVKREPLTPELIAGTEEMCVYLAASSEDDPLAIPANAVLERGVMLSLLERSGGSRTDHLSQLGELATRPLRRWISGATLKESGATTGTVAGLLRLRAEFESAPAEGLDSTQHKVFGYTALVLEVAPELHPPSGATLTVPCECDESAQALRHIACGLAARNRKEGYAAELASGGKKRDASGVAAASLHKHRLSRFDGERKGCVCDVKAAGCRHRPTAYRCAEGCDFDVCQPCYDKAQISLSDELLVVGGRDAWAEREVRLPIDPGRLTLQLNFWSAADGEWREVSTLSQLSHKSLRQLGVQRRPDEDASRPTLRICDSGYRPPSPRDPYPGHKSASCCSIC
jgi:hypothetical protein